jgi:hypothetical protein
MAVPFDFSTFDSGLLRTFDGGGQLIQDAVMWGAGSLGSDFTVLKTRDKAPLVRVNIKDAIRAASDTFAAQAALEVKSRIATFKEADIDIEIKYSDVKEAYQTYLGWLKAPNRTLSEVRENPFELFFIRQIIAQHFEFIRLKTAWKGVYHATNVGANNISDGFIAMFTAGRAGDIAAGHVFTGATITNSNGYAQVNGVAAKIAAADEKFLAQDLNVYVSRGTYDKYRVNRRTLFPEFVGPADQPTVLDDYSNMKFVVDPGLAGKDTIAITKKENLLFVCNEDPGQFSLSVVKAIKSWQISIRISAAFDYASPDWLYLNDLV